MAANAPSPHTPLRVCCERYFPMAKYKASCMRLSAKKACFQFAECSFSSVKIVQTESRTSSLFECFAEVQPILYKDRHYLRNKYYSSHNNSKFENSTLPSATIQHSTLNIQHSTLPKAFPPSNTPKPSLTLLSS